MTVHPMAYNMNTRVRWAAVERALDGIDVAGLRVLDVGCGLGYFSVKLAERKAIVEGIDIDEGAVSYVEKHLGISARLLDVVQEDLPMNSYDIVFVGEVLEHVKESARLYAKLRDALRPGGLLFLSTPALEGWLTRSPGKQLGHDHGGQKHERDGYWKAELDGFAHDVGLELVKHLYCVHTGAELFMQLTKVGYLWSRRDYEGQSDVLALVNMPSFLLLRFVFPLIWPLIRLEDWFARQFGFRGHCHLQVVRRPA